MSEEVLNESAVEEVIAVGERAEEHTEEHAEENTGEPLEESIEAQLPPLAAISSVLFVSPKPVSFERLIEVTGLEPETVEEMLRQLTEIFQEEVHGFTVVEVAGGYQLRTSPKAAALVRRLFPAKVKLFGSHQGS